MKGWSLIFGYFCINIAIGVLHGLGLFSVSSEPVISAGGITNLFSLTVFSITIGIAGIASLLTRQYIFGAGALLIWVVGILYNPIMDIFVGLPVLINQTLSYSPLVATVVGGAVTAFAGVILFMFLLEILSGRQIS